MGGSGCIDPRYLDLSTSWKLVVSFTPPPPLRFTPKLVWKILRIENLLAQWDSNSDPPEALPHFDIIIQARENKLVDEYMAENQEDINGIIIIGAQSSSYCICRPTH
jgi:hypothetical protein